MFERIIRPFQTGDVLQTKRIAKAKSAPTGEVARLTWGAAGDIPKGVMQQAASPGGVPFADGGLHGDFKVVHARQTWTQTEKPVTETVTVDGVDLKRVRQIRFDTINDAPSASKKYNLANATSDAIAGLQQQIDASRASSAVYKTNWN